MAEALRGMMMLEERYGLKGKQRETIHQGKSLYENVIDVGIKQDKQNSLAKKHALSSERGLAWDRGMKDIKSFNSHMPDVLRRLDWYFSEENKNMITPVDLDTENRVDYVKENQEEPVTEEQEKEMKKEYKQEFEEELKKLPTDKSKLKSSLGGGKGKSVFTVKSEEAQSENVTDPNEESEEKESENENIGAKPTQEQEKAFKEFSKGAVDSSTKRYGLILIDREGNIKNHYKSMTEFKDSEEYNKFNKYKGYLSVSKRQAGTSYIEDTTGNALYFVPLKSYRGHYETATWLRRHKKQKKNKDELIQDITENK